MCKDDIGEASRRYYNAIHNLPDAAVVAIEAHPADEPGDSPHVLHCKKCYRAMQAFGLGAVDMREPNRHAARV